MAVDRQHSIAPNTILYRVLRTTNQIQNSSLTMMGYAVLIRFTLIKKKSGIILTHKTFSIRINKIMDMKYS